MGSQSDPRSGEPPASVLCLLIITNEDPEHPLPDDNYVTPKAGNSTLAHGKDRPIGFKSIPVSWGPQTFSFLLKTPPGSSEEELGMAAPDRHQAAQKFCLTEFGINLIQGTSV